MRGAIWSLVSDVMFPIFWIIPMASILREYTDTRRSLEPVVGSDGSSVAKSPDRRRRPGLLASLDPSLPTTGSSDLLVSVYSRKMDAMGIIQKIGNITSETSDHMAPRMPQTVRTPTQGGC